MADNSDVAVVETRVLSAAEQLRQFFVTVPIPLLHFVRQRSDLLCVLAYALSKRLDVTDSQKKLPSLDVKGVMADLKLRFNFDVDALPQLAEQAEGMLTDFRMDNVERSPSVAKVPWAILCDAYAGDMQLDFALVYLAIASQFSFAIKKAKPVEIGSAKIQRLVCGYSSCKSYQAGLASEAFTVRMDTRRVRYITHRLAVKKLVERFTYGRSTWYSMPWVTKARQLDLPKYVGGVIARRKANVKAYERMQVEGKQKVVEAIAKMERTYQQAIDTAKAGPAVPCPVDAGADILAYFGKFGAKLYGRGTLAARGARPQAIVEFNGTVHETATRLPDELVRTLASFGATVKRC